MTCYEPLLSIFESMSTFTSQDLQRQFASFCRGDPLPEFRLYSEDSSSSGSQASSSDPQPSSSDPQPSSSDPQHSSSHPQASSSDPQASSSHPQASPSDPQDSSPSGSQPSLPTSQASLRHILVPQRWENPHQVLRETFTRNNVLAIFNGEYNGQLMYLPNIFQSTEAHDPERFRFYPFNEETPYLASNVLPSHCLSFAIDGEIILFLREFIPLLFENSFFVEAPKGTGKSMLAYFIVCLLMGIRQNIPASPRPPVDEELG